MPIDVLHSNLFFDHISFSASFQRETHKHHLSPAFPGKSQFGFGVIKSFPFFNEYSKTHLSQLHKQREFQSQLK
jgi:hypothetical protein